MSEIREYLLHNADLTVGVLTRGATISKILFPNDQGRVIDLTLGYDRPEEYAANMGFFGVTVGRCTNRIENARFNLGGQTYSITANAGRHHIHGGNESFALQDFSVVSVTDSRIVFHLDSPDGQDGYPGNLSLEVVYYLENNALNIVYEACSDRVTVVNITNHAYFNLNNKGSVLGHEARSSADTVCFSDLDGIPRSRESVVGTPFDFRNWQPFNRFQLQKHDQTDQFRGYDHHFIVCGDEFRHMISVRSHESRIQMDAWSTQEGFQLYTSNNLCGIIGKEGIAYEPYDAFCIEMQTAPNAVNHPFERGVVLRAGQKYYQRTSYAFSHY